MKRSAPARGRAPSRACRGSTPTAGRHRRRYRRARGFRSRRNPGTSSGHLSGSEKSRSTPTSVKRSEVYAQHWVIERAAHLVEGAPEAVVRAGRGCWSTVAMSGTDRRIVRSSSRAGAPLAENQGARRAVHNHAKDLAIAVALLGRATAATCTPAPGTVYPCCPVAWESRSLGLSVGLATEQELPGCCLGLQIPRHARHASASRHAHV